MLISARGTVRVTAKGLDFVTEDRFSSRLADGEYGKVQVYEVSVSLSSLSDIRPDQYWAKGYRLRKDGSVGSRHTSSVLLDHDQLPAELQAAIRQAYIIQVKQMSSEPGVSESFSHYHTD